MQFENLININLSFNKLRNVKALLNCPFLKKIDLSYNFLRNRNSRAEIWSLKFWVESEIFL